MSAAEGVRRITPPQAVQKLKENLYLVHVGLSESPGADWKRLFYETQQQVAGDFIPREVEITGSTLRLRASNENVAERVATVDRWIERANQKEAAMGLRTEEQRRRRQQMAQEHMELVEVNARWAKL
ncbi:MAG TPA: hypothetical protein VJW51_06165 [Candidatus Acidoferrales bacterium]|nr:hypothetical protein [Candidatus Acidoferrales bacterium]